MLAPGAVPDTLAHVKSSMHRQIETGHLPSPFHFVGDGAYPDSDEILTPCSRRQLQSDVHGYINTSK